MDIVISLGGSIVNPGRINLVFLRRFRRLLLGPTLRRDRFFLVVGGGKPTRLYQQAARALVRPANRDLDRLGIASTKLNAELIRILFAGHAYPEVITDPTRSLGKPKKINVFSGWKPGWSTDYVAVRIAQRHGLKSVFNLSNVDYVYSGDPRKQKNARRFTALSWTQYRKLIKADWDPGANYPFDPVASRLAQRSRLKVVVLNGRKVSNLENALKRQSFAGTVIGPRR